MSEVLDNISCPIAPVADSHLANKAYVDAAVASGAGTASVSGDNVVSIPALSLISCGLAPTEDSHLVNKAYVDAAVAAAGSATPIEEPAALGRVVYVNTLSDAADHTGTSLRDAIEAVTQNSSLVIKFSVSGTITLEQGEIVIPVGNIAIDGEDKITISGGGVSRVFSMTNAYAVLSLHRLVITGGNGVGATASAKLGGAVLLGDVRSTFEARGCTFVENTITSAETPSGGGALCAVNGHVFLYDCLFVRNSVLNTKTGSSASGGGAVYITYSGCYVYVVRCTFVENTNGGSGTSEGGAVRDCAGVYTDCVFRNNRVVSGTARRGGAISNAGTLALFGCRFEGNSVGDANTSCTGGAVDAYGYGIRIEGGIFSGNSAYYGGAISLRYTNGRSVYYVVRKSQFEDNTAVSRGSAICFNYGSGTIEDCEFRNHAVGSASGVIYTYGYTDKPFQVTVNRCKFTGNTLSGTTNGLIYCANLSDVYVYNSVFTGNSATTAGVNVALLYTTGTSSITAGNLTMTDNEKFRSFCAASGSIKIYNSVDVGNVAVPTLTNVTAISPLTNWRYGAGRIAYDSSKPLFAADGYTPVAGSQVIDAGDNDYVETVYDLVGEARVSGAAVDVGAVEWQGA
ncbi:MAG: hypothetical protein IKE69_01715 [Thermoguttaceae bacterium]|nr:hypothetical protein [Thermoguttaceae bacterium]